MLNASLVPGAAKPQSKPINSQHMLWVCLWAAIVYTQRHHLLSSNADTPVTILITWPAWLKICHYLYVGETKLSGPSQSRLIPMWVIFSWWWQGQFMWWVLLTASSSASWSLVRPPLSCVSGRESTMWPIVCCWPQSWSSDAARPPLVHLSTKWTVWKHFCHVHDRHGRSKPGRWMERWHSRFWLTKWCCYVDGCCFCPDGATRCDALW